ncbi:MAG: LytTR family transcriptional regulator DNA-binding domain-containing protein [Eubacterium sp.]|nr:LytTR family transcriptional regulator DNA-binding domain-containing protein [Eubacterium sp.]
MKEILLLERNPREQERILSVIGQVSSRVKISVAETEEEAYIKMMQGDIDLFILGVASGMEQYGDVKGLTLVERIRWIEKYRYTPMIVLTNLEDPGRRMINDFHCFGFLEQPVETGVLRKVIGDAIHAPKGTRLRKNIYVKQDGMIQAIHIDEIIYIENRQRYLLVHTAQGERMIKYETAKNFMKKLGDSRFLQCSRQVIVNVDHIQEVDYVNRYISFRGVEEVVEIGSAMKRKFREALECSKSILWM